MFIFRLNNQLQAYSHDDHYLICFCERLWVFKRAVERV